MSKQKKVLMMGNWKMFGSHSHIQEWFLQFSKADIPLLSCEWVLFPPFPYLESVGQLCRDKKIKWGAQNCAAYDEGAYTGEVSAKMLKDCGCTYVLIGHSERRHGHHETDELLRLKIEAAQRAGLTPVFCIGETGEERRQNITFTVLERQLRSLASCNLNDLVIAYEPVWAIGTGLVATPEDIQRVHAHIRAFLGTPSPIVYGGSVKPDNAKGILKLPDVDGALVGGASLKASDFIRIGAESMGHM
jgi:triosephosphate isomerase